MMHGGDGFRLLEDGVQVTWEHLRAVQGGRDDDEVEPWIADFMVLGRIVGMEHVPDDLLNLPWAVDFEGVIFRP